MNKQSYDAFTDGMTGLRRGLADLRESRNRKEDIKGQIEREVNNAAQQEKSRAMDAELQEKLEQGRNNRLKMEIESRIAIRDKVQAEVEAERMARANPGGQQGDLLGAEIEGARARVAQVKQQTASEAPTTLDQDLVQTDDWSRQMFRAQQAMQQAQAAGDQEALFVAQGRIGRLQRLGEKYGSEKPTQRMVKVRRDIPGTADKPAGYMEFEEAFDEKKHGAGAMPAVTPPGVPGTVPLNSIEAMKQRMIAGR